ncbi:MAG: sugar phosphate nucleotidyltransferase [Acidobacteriota bacterium]
MKGVVLCAGMGIRLFPYTQEIPKCLLKVGQKTLLEYIIENYKKSGIKEIFLVTGYKEEKIKTLVKEKSCSTIHFITNQNYMRTNTAYSLNLALKHINDDFILINGDMLFDQTILDDLLSHPQKNCVVVDNKILLDQEEVKVIAQNGVVSKIGKNLNPTKCMGEAIGINKISHKSIPKLSDVFNALEKKGELYHFFEKGFDILSHKDCSFGILLTHKPWTEIDTQEDYDYAKNEIFTKLCHKQ